MTVFQILYTILIRPLQIFFEYVFSVAEKGLSNPGLSVIALSLAMNLLVLPLYNRADAVQEEERDIENKLKKGVAHIRKTFKGDEKMMMLQTYYRQNGYKPTDVFKGSVSLLLQIPFFIAAYQFLSNLSSIRGVSFGPIADLGAQDALLTIGAVSINLLPIVMTAINLISCIIFTKGYPLRTKIQLFGMAVFFLFFLYKSPAGLVFYWTLNNVFSLGKTLYYKSALAKKILNEIFAFAGILLLISIPVIRIKFTGSKSFLLIVFVLAIVCIAPMAVSILKKKNVFKNKKALSLENNRYGFLFGCIYLTILLGVLIPSGVIASSAQEFVDMYHFKSPLWFVLSSFCIAVGLFMVWLPVFYALSKKTGRAIFDAAVWILSGIATADFIFFGKNRAVLNSSLGYTEKFSIPMKEIAINLIVILFVVAVFVLIFKFAQKNLSWVLAIGSVVLVIMSGVNVVKTVSSTSELKAQAETIKSEMPTCTLSKNGQNVIVIMLDKAPGMFMEYFINEKPEIKEMYSGFTYYPNTISFGAFTNFGSPEIFGGYEYTPEEMNKRDTILLKDKHNEALKVMPAIFDENGYNVTVCDAPYANYQWISDMSIFDDYPNVKTYYTKGYFWQAHKESVSNRNYRNFFCYSLMKCSPLVLQNHFYNDGFYNENLQANDFTDELTNGNGQIIRSNTQAQGIYDRFMWDFATLQNLTLMTEISDDGANNYFVLENDATHDPIMFQEPGYIISYDVDNTQYEAEHSDRYTVNGKTLNMHMTENYTFYQTNMACILSLGEWFDYLKEEGVYDNTRIIITSDHGRALHLNDSYHLDDGSEELMDIEAYYPLLLIKDFNASEFTINEEFMTNADVPTYAMEGLIDNPVNPFTGKEINNDEKYSHPQKVIASDKWVVDENNGTKFLPGLWFSVEKDMRDKNNWTFLGEE